FHPVIVSDQVLLADHRSVISFHLKTGKELFRFELKGAGLRDPGPGIDADIALPRFTLTADRERAYVRLGRLHHGLDARGRPRKGSALDEPSYLVCLDLTQPGQQKNRLL